MPTIGTCNTELGDANHHLGLFKQKKTETHRIHAKTEMACEQMKDCEQEENPESPSPEQLHMQRIPQTCVHLRVPKCGTRVKTDMVKKTGDSEPGHRFVVHTGLLGRSCAG